MHRERNRIRRPSTRHDTGRPALCDSTVRNTRRCASGGHCSEAEHHAGEDTAEK
jgi:hypothetical protein